MERVLNELRERAFEQNLYAALYYQRTTVESIRQLICRLLAMELDAVLEASLRIFLGYVEELGRLFQEEAELTMMISGWEIELEEGLGME